MREVLEENYKILLQKYGFKINNNDQQLGDIIKSILRSFMGSHKNVAIYGYDEKARQIIGMFIFELKDIKYMVSDNETDNGSEKSGYTVISEVQIREHGIDGVILFSEENREKNFLSLKNLYPNIDCMDIYGEIARGTGLKLNPYQRYGLINAIQIKIARSDKFNLQDHVALIAQYIEIKDFPSAISKTKELLLLIGGGI